MTKTKLLVIMKDNKYLSIGFNGYKFTDNYNLASTYKDQKQAESVAKEFGGQVTELNYR